MRLSKGTKKSTKFRCPSFKSSIKPAAYSDDIPIPVFKESLLGDTEPSEHHEETSDMNQDDNFFCNF